MNTTQEKNKIKQRIIEDTLQAKKRNEDAIGRLNDSVAFSNTASLSEKVSKA